MILSLFKTQNFKSILLHVLSNDPVEMLREKSLIFLHESVKLLNGKQHNNIDGIVEFLEELYVDICPILYSRFVPSSSNTITVGCSCPESAEEIRFNLLEFMMDLLVLLSSSLSCKQQQQHPHKPSMIQATSILIQTLYKSSLHDPYANLKQISCKLLKCVLCRDFPHVVKMHSKSLLNTLSFRQEQKTIHKPLLCHRHSKIRLLAMETIGSIIISSENLCYMDELLLDYVFPGFDQCSFDKSLPVRTTLLSTLGKILMFRWTATTPSSSPDNEKVSCRIILVLLEGYSSFLNIQSSSNSSFDNKLFQEAKKQLFELSSLYHSKYVKEKPDLGKQQLQEQKKHQYYLAFMIQDYFSLILPQIVQDINSANSSVNNCRQLQAIKTLEISLSCCGRLSSDKADSSFPNKQDVKEIITTLCSCIRYYQNENDSDGKIIFDAVESCIITLGKLLYEDVPLFASSITELILSQLKPQTKNISSILSSPSQVVSCIITLNSLLKAPTAGKVVDSQDMRILKLLHDITKTISSRDFILDDSNNEVTYITNHPIIMALYSLCETMITFYIQPIMIMILSQKEAQTEQTPSQQILDDIVFNTLICCTFILGSVNIPATTQLQLNKDVLHLIKQLSLPSSKKNDMRILDQHFVRIVNYLTHNNNITWEETSTSFLLFDAFLRHCHGITLATHSKLVFKTMEPYFSTTSSYQIKLKMMALLESIISNESFPLTCLHYTAEESSPSFSLLQQVLEKVILPNLIWKSGGMASALRKISAATLYSLLKRGISPLNKDSIETTLSWMYTLPNLFPAIITNISDDDAIIRQLMLLSLSMLLQIFSTSYVQKNSNPYHDSSSFILLLEKIYPALLKCLDDCNKQVRQASCTAIQSFLEILLEVEQDSHPSISISSADTTMINYMVEQLMLHMDDLDLDIQESIYDLMKFLIIRTKELQEKREDNIGRMLRLLEREIRDAKLSHRTSYFCDLLLEECMR